VKLPIAISLQFTCIKIPQGHSIRLSISAACFPAYPVNTGTGKPPHEEKAIEAKIITLKIRCQGDSPTQVILPINT
jgi:hypothetical protein